MRINNKGEEKNSKNCSGLMGQGQGGCVPCPAVKPCVARITRTISEDEFDDLAFNGAVLLNIYDLNEEWLLSNEIFQEVLELGGAFHTGVEVYGREWSFGTAGVGASCPRSHDVHVYRRSVLIGYAKCTPEEVEAILEDEMLPRWAGRSYDLLSRNCCTFSRALCKRLTGNVIPDWVDRLPRVLDVVTKPVKGVADVAAGVGKSMNSTPVSNSFVRRDCSIESMDSNSSVATLAPNLMSTPRNESFVIPCDPGFHSRARPAERVESFVIPCDPGFHSRARPAFGVAY